MGIPNQINVGRFNRALTRLFRVLETPSPSLASEIMPVVVLLGDVPENALLREERLCSGGMLQSPVAAQSTRISLVNPATPTGNAPTILVLEGFFAVIPGGDILWTVPSSAAPAQSSAGFFRDTRLNPNQSPTGFITGDNAVLVNAGTPIDANSATPFFYPFPAVIAPGNSLRSNVASVNVGLRISYLWRERVLAPEELSAG